MNKRGFASDNNAGIHPLVLQEMSRVNIGHTIGYGNDPYTDEAIGLFRKQLGDQSDVFFVFTGTGANVLGISAVTRSYNSVITAFTAHIEQDECGAPEKFSGCKLLTVDTPDGKLTPAILGKHMHGFDFEHHSQPRVISISQATEMGTVYTPDEVRSLADFAHSRNMLLHMDGARISNAAVSLNLPFRSFTTDAGVDILSFGGTKNGMMVGEAVCFLRPGLAADFKYIRKQGMQLASKMRFISAQFIAWFRNDLWKELATHSNEMALKLYNEIKNIKGITVTQPVQSNGIFVMLPEEVATELRRHFFFYPWNEETSEYRWMTSWDTSEDDIKSFAELVKKLMADK
ncbi:MAG: low specificity L-threonine aldolase [Bacteroidales bacterium]|nr:low specificity L-threonine aldolase [Bacteroidales bacterium]